MTSQMASRLEQGEFIVTSELTPPKGTDLESLFAKAEMLAKGVDAFNLTDCHGANMAMSPMALGCAVSCEQAGLAGLAWLAGLAGVAGMVSCP